MEYKDFWPIVQASESSLRITNPIRDIVDKLIVPENASKAFVSLSIGMSMSIQWV